MSGSRYWEGPGDRHYAYNIEPSYECPVGKAAAAAQKGEPGGCVDLAAEALGVEPKLLGRLLLRSSCGSRARDERERLTDRCYLHGCKMSKRGYRAFIDEPVPEGEVTDLGRLSREMSRALGGDGVQRRVVESRWCDTKREAREWAWARCEAARRAEAVTA